MARGMLCRADVCTNPALPDSAYCEDCYGRRTKDMTLTPEMGPNPHSHPDPLATLVEDNWKHRSKGMRCETCMWFAEKETSIPGMVFGRCRRRAPTMSGFPAVYGTDWCGDHKLNEEKL